ncbi:hypothetical protein HDU97_000795 [Phlyctochytrium planicorne]|nr:hypothetical protein HDU97_000795 [Phlyctochytrium planicorne]
MKASFIALVTALLAAVTSSVQASSNGLHPRGTPSPLADKIKKVVVLVMENRSFDNIAGYYNHTSDIDNLIQYEIKNKKQFCNNVVVANPKNGKICFTPTAPDVQEDDPEHDFNSVMFQIYGKLYANVSLAPVNPPMSGFVEEQWRLLNQPQDLTKVAGVFSGLPLTNVPYTYELAKNFVLFDRWFASVPGPTNPNKAFITSATSGGRGDNSDDFQKGLLTQKSIFQLLSESGKTWWASLYCSESKQLIVTKRKNYDGSFTGSPPDAKMYKWVNSNPEALKNVVPLNDFLSDAAAGTLPDFSFINPECCSIFSFHPPSSVMNGELFVKGIYESLRASPSWNETVFILSFDEHGGFADHVPTPRAASPDGIAHVYNANGQIGRFFFDRLGVRVPTFVISPYVPAGLVSHAPPAPFKQEYDHTSILKFVENLWGLPPLTMRDGQAPDFAHVLSLSEARADCPLTLGQIEL